MLDRQATEATLIKERQVRQGARARDRPIWGGTSEGATPSPFLPEASNTTSLQGVFVQHGWLHAKACLGCCLPMSVVSWRSTEAKRWPGNGGCPYPCSVWVGVFFISFLLNENHKKKKRTKTHERTCLLHTLTRGTSRSATKGNEWPSRSLARRWLLSPQNRYRYRRPVQNESTGGGLLATTLPPPPVP